MRILLFRFADCACLASRVQRSWSAKDEITFGFHEPALAAKPEIFERDAEV